ncbi:NAD(P)/FAD-dependent oxidoreductase [Orrella sp. JC864]|uniref:NAD(P)/FAD-dependent oxidoreductase n=1 Tax=Orrella sp. JC864 TaxID=3120298 RepID=UPI003008F33A
MQQHGHAPQGEIDAAIVGAGPAGASCALWLARLGLRPLLLEAGHAPGGLERDNPYPDQWIAVLPGVTGMQVAANIGQSLREAGVPMRLRQQVVSARRHGQGFVLELADAAGGGPWRLPAPRLVIASGVRPRGLGPGGCCEPAPGVLYGPGSHIAAQDYAGLSVAVLGGGDNGFENYGYVRGRGARQVHLYARSVRAQRQWVARADGRDVFLGPYEVDVRARTVNGRPYDLILVFHGWAPQAGFADPLGLVRDARGFILTDAASARASVPGVYAIGEAAQRMHPCVVTALADGVVAAKAIQAEVESARLADG